MADKALKYAELLDAYRVVPRLWLVGYGWMLYRICEWFMALPDPDTQQAALLTVVWGAGGWITSFYMSTGRKWQ